MITKRHVLMPLIAIVLLGFALRVHNLGVVPLRGDEAFSALNWARLPLSQTLPTLAPIDPHPPLTYTLYRVWGLLVGINSEFALRILPALLNLLGIPAMYAIGKRLRGHELGLLAALMWAVHPFEIWHAQDFRNYAMWAAFSAVALWLALRVIDRGRRTDWILYIAAATVAMLTFYTELFSMAALSLYVLIARRSDRPFLVRWLAAQVAIAGAGLTAFLVLQGSLLGSGSYGGTIARFNAPQWLTRFVPALTFGETLPDTFTVLLWPLLVVGMVVALVLIGRKQRGQAMLLGILAFVPPILLGIISIRMYVFHPRYVISAVPAILMIFALGALSAADLVRGLTVRRVIPFLFAAIWVGIAAYGLDNYFNNPTFNKSKNWPTLTAYLQQNVTADDLVIQQSVDAAFGFYYHAAATDIGLPANPQEPDADVIKRLEDSQDAYHSIWLVANPFPDWPNANIVKPWLDANMQLVVSEDAGDLPVRQYMRWEVDDWEIANTPLAVFSDTAALMGARVIRPPQGNESLTVVLYWRALGQSDAPLKVFVHLIGPNNPATGTPLWTQDDHFPQDGRIETNTWDTTVDYRDVYVLPLADVPDGEYRLEVGFYDPVTNGRVPVGDGDSYVIQAVTLN